MKLILAGFTKRKIGKVAVYGLEGEIQERHATDNPGADWFGYSDVITRLIKGSGEEYSIPWGLMPLQDAVDVAVSLIKITIAVSRWTYGVIRPDTSARRRARPLTPHGHHQGHWFPPFLAWVCVESAAHCAKS